MGFFCWKSEMVIGRKRCERLHAIGFNRDKAREFKNAGLPVVEYKQAPDCLHADGSSGWIERTH